MSGYNGWANYQTWNVALWLQNDRARYDMMRYIMATTDEPLDDYDAWHTTQRIFSAVFGENSLDETVTPDDVPVSDMDIDWDEIKEIYNAEVSNV